MGESGADASGVDLGCFDGGREGGFEGEGIFVEPVEECTFAEYTAVGELGGVDVGV